MGELVHRDSLGNEQVTMPGRLILMTAGHDTAHSEGAWHLPRHRAGRSRGLARPAPAR